MRRAYEDADNALPPGLLEDLRNRDVGVCAGRGCVWVRRCGGDCGVVLEAVEEDVERGARDAKLRRHLVQDVSRHRGECRAGGTGDKLSVECSCVSQCVCVCPACSSSLPTAGGRATVMVVDLITRTATERM